MSKRPTNLEIAQRRAAEANQGLVRETIRLVPDLAKTQSALRLLRQIDAGGPNMPSDVGQVVEIAREQLAKVLSTVKPLTAEKLLQLAKAADGAKEPAAPPVEHGTEYRGAVEQHEGT